MLRNCRSLLTSFLLNLYHEFPVCSICRSCGHLNKYLNPEGPAVCPEGRIKLQQNTMGAEKTLCQGNMHMPHPLGVTALRTLRQSLLLLLHGWQQRALYNPGWVLFQVHPSRMVLGQKRNLSSHITSVKVETVCPWIPMDILNDACLLN